MNLSPAERVRSMLAVGLELRLDGERHARHVVMPDGSVLLRHLPGAELDGPVVLSGADVSSVPQPDRVRGGLEMVGRLTAWDGPRPEGIVRHLAGPAGQEAPDAGADVEIVRFRPESITLTWRCGTAPGSVAVDLEAYVAAAPDPLVGAELTWLPHLQRDHARELRAVAARVCPVLDDGLRVRALALDTHGLTLRLYADADHLDVRAEFPAPASCTAEVRAAFAGLLETAPRR